MPWKNYVLEVVFRTLRLQSLVGLLLVIFWAICGWLLGCYLHIGWGTVGYGIGFPAGFIISSIFTWIIFGRKKTH
jgi:hypothetical protein